MEKKRGWKEKTLAVVNSKPFYAFAIFIILGLGMVIAADIVAKQGDFFVDGNLGVGTSTPTQKLEVAGDVNISSNILSITGTAPRVKLSETGQTNEWTILQDGNRFDIREHHNADTRLAIIDGGNIGINDASPATMLEITGDSTRAAILTITGTSDTANNNIGLDIDSARNANIWLDKGAAAQVGYINYATAGTTKWYVGIPADSSEDYRISSNFGTDTTPPFLIDSATNRVGIGTAVPESQFDIIGTDYLQQRIGSSKTTATIQRTGINAQHYTAAEEPVAMIQAYVDSATNQIMIGGGAGTTNAAKTINFYTAATTTTLGGTVRMSIDSAGEVDVVGDLDVGGTIYGETIVHEVPDTVTGTNGCSQLDNMDQDPRSWSCVDCISASTGADSNCGATSGIRVCMCEGN